ncbi:MAG TPA: nuclear transport factor 2 family protein [Pseudolabrys sp.]|nr:nuclear transport factor 2 family protein [Pseudolabrys sp.]
MTDRAEIEEMLRQAYAARARADLEGVLKFFAPDVSFSISGAPHVTPIAMWVDGLASLRAALQQLIGAFVITEYELRTILIDADQAAVQWRATFRSPTTNAELTTDLFDLITVKDGRIASFTEFCDTAAAAQLLVGR